MSFILKGSLIFALQWKGWFRSKTSIQEYRNEMQNSYWTCAWIIWYMFSVHCEESRIDHLTPRLVVTMPYACWFLWRADNIDDFKWYLQFQIGFCRVALREVYFEGPNRVWRALTTLILTIGSDPIQWPSNKLVICGFILMGSSWAGGRGGRIWASVVATM